ncbi:glycosyltransferase family 4 protein [uncultured Flavobacterium sp.]|uniref:glycosyltransferase family 4 protein n=1 Tax=uncultured Flavobacterium sp. TaxID=165435 RepID=UPI0030EC1E45|tara:strand:- start:2612 stop:3622 length:1011 start_codon:yes stop_codon:yes gene_type:complete
MKNLLYIGNKLHKHGFNKTSIETLGVFLADEGYTVAYTSVKKNQIIRLLDMMMTTFFKAKKVDYILIDTYSTSSFWYAFFCSQIARFFKVKYIPILHGGDLPNRLKSNPYLCKLLFKNAYANVAPSNYLVEKFKKNGFENIVFIPNSIQIDEYKFKNRIAIQPHLLWVRSFAKIYNPKMAVEVYRLLKEKHPKASLTMVGPDKDGSLIETRHLAESLNLKVDFTGKLSKEEWTNLASKHDVFINTTHFDNTPVSIIEAMALGLPVVSTNVGGIPYMLSTAKNALLVNDNEPIEMANAIEVLLKDSKKVEELTSNAKLLIETMDWHAVKLKWMKLLE